jgi:hypothetical protein
VVGEVGNCFCVPILYLKDVVSPIGQDVQVAGAPGPEESTASVSGLEVSVSELSLDNDDGFAADMTPNRPFGTSKCAVRGSISMSSPPLPAVRLH